MMNSSTGTAMLFRNRTSWSEREQLGVAFQRPRYMRDDQTLFAAAIYCGAIDKSA